MQLKSFIFVSGGNIVRQLLVFIAQLYIVRKLGVHSYGELTIVFSLYLVIAGISDFGSRIYCWKEVLASDLKDRPAVAIKKWMARTSLAALFLLPILLGISLFFRGSIETLLLLYATAILANQASFDWFFLALDRKLSLFLFNTVSGILYLLILFFILRSERDLIFVPIAFIVSYVLPAGVLMGKDLWNSGGQYFRSSRELVGIFRDGASIPSRSRPYFLYDFMQRLYTTAIFIVAWKFFSKSMIGQFRVAHLLFTFIASMAIYLGASLFNKVHEEKSGKNSGETISYGIAAIILIILPFSIFGYGITAPFARLLLKSQFDKSSLLILIGGLSLPALGNFIRETAVAAGHTRFSTLSYFLTIMVTGGLIVVAHQHSLAFLSVSLLIGEGMGLLLLIRFLPFPLFSKIRFRTYAVGMLVGLGLLLAEKIQAFIFQDIKGITQATLEISIVSLLFFFYLIILRKNGMGLWVNEQG